LERVFVGYVLLNRNSRGPGTAMYHELLITDARTVDPYFVMSCSEIPRMQCKDHSKWVTIISISSVPHGSQVDMKNEMGYRINEPIQGCTCVAGGHALG
jgi:hypothetical protein